MIRTSLTVDACFWHPIKKTKYWKRFENETDLEEYITNTGDEPLIIRRKE